MNGNTETDKPVTDVRRNGQESSGSVTALPQNPVLPDPIRSHAPEVGHWYPYALAGVVVVGFFGVIVLMMLPLTTINTGNRDIVFMLFGGLVTGFSMVLSYFFGSSAGSAQKTVELAKIANSNRTPPQNGA